MDIVVTGRHTTVSDRFRQHIAEKAREGPAGSLLALAASRSSSVTKRTADSPRPVTAWRSRVTSRAPWCAPKRARRTSTQRSTSPSRSLLERLRRKHDRTVRRGRHSESVAAATAFVPPEPQDEGATSSDDEGGAFGDSPIEVREKVHTSAPMTLDQALREMEPRGPRLLPLPRPRHRQGQRRLSAAWLVLRRPAPRPQRQRDPCRVRLPGGHCGPVRAGCSVLTCAPSLGGVVH